MQVKFVKDLKGKYILYKNRIHKVVDYYISGKVWVLLTNTTRINVLKSDEDNFLESIMVANDRESLVDYERESPDDIEMIEETIHDQEEVSPGSVDKVESESASSTPSVIPTGVEESNNSAREQSNKQRSDVPVIKESNSDVTVLPAASVFHQSPIETVIQKHGAELATSLMDTLRKAKAGVMKKDQVESVCNIARELTSLAKEEINLLRTLKQ